MGIWNACTITSVITIFETLNGRKNELVNKWISRHTNVGNCKVRMYSQFIQNIKVTFGDSDSPIQYRILQRLVSKCWWWVSGMLPSTQGTIRPLSRQGMCRCRRLEADHFRNGSPRRRRWMRILLIFASSFLGLSSRNLRGLQALSYGLIIFALRTDVGISSVQLW